jgi:hypothetical protein
MPWRGSTTTQDRILAFLPYLLPFIRAFVVGYSVLSIFAMNATVAMFGAIFAFIMPLQGFLGNFTVSILLFLALYILVVRNEQIPHFIRFNTMQSLMIDIALSLLGAITGLFGQLGPLGFVFGILFIVINLSIIGFVIYALVQCLRGVYAEIPTLSDAAYAQVR